MDVRAEVRVDAPVDRAFQVFVARCHDWWPREHRLGEASRIDVVLEPRVGGRWYERTADGGERDWGRVLAWHPPGRLSLSWQIGVGFVPNTDPDRASRVDVRFRTLGPGRTQVTVIHSELPRHGPGWEIDAGRRGGRGWLAGDPPGLRGGRARGRCRKGLTRARSAGSHEPGRAASVCRLAGDAAGRSTRDGGDS